MAFKNLSIKRFIAVIGAGISGTSAAYFLNKNKGLNATIDIYSKDVGGRLQTISIGGHEYETGGSILHPRNRYMKQFVEDFGMALLVVTHIFCNCVDTNIYSLFLF